MIYVAIPLVILTSLYSITYGISVIKNEKNKLGGAAVILFSLAGILLPLGLLILRR